MRVSVPTVKQRFLKMKEGVPEIRMPGRLCASVSSDGRLVRNFCMSGAVTGKFASDNVRVGEN